MNAHTIRLNLSDRRPLLASLRRRQLWLKSIAVVVTVAFLGLYLQPLAIAANLPSRAPAKTAGPSNEEKLAQALETIEQRLDQLHTKLSTEDKGAKAESVLRGDINTLDQTTRQGLSEIEKGVKTKTPSQALLERHTKSIAAYQRAITALSNRADQTLREALTSGTTNERLSLQAIRASITKLDKNTRDGLNYIGRDLKDKKANAAVLKRHKNVAKQYQTDITNVKAALDTWATAMADAKRTAKTKPAPTQDTTKDTATLKSLRSELDALDRQAINDFNTIEQHITDKNLPAIIMQRHREAVATYETEMAAVKANLDAIAQATSDRERSVLILQARDHLRAKQARKGPKTKFDPNDLPNKSLQPNPNNKPKLTPGEFVRAGLFSNPSVKLVAHGSFRIDQLPSASDPAYLAATTEVTLTDAIRAKAAELNHNPVQIYNWVRNSVEWIPTWGATQDADVTLGSKRGNAMDIASLLIALFRASDIPARYVHGTIEVPADKFMNWAGGFTDVKAAGDYASSGGIPITGIVTGGQITKFQMEHIWVEAAVDFQPSRGASNKSADSWVRLDASYKQYDYLLGLDVTAISGMNLNDIAQTFANSGTSSPTEGWVSGLNQAVVQNARTQAQSALQNYVNSNLPNATVGDIIGGRTIKVLPSSVLATNLPYQKIATGARYGAIPGALQNTMTFGFGVDFLGEPINAITFPWARLNNHKVTLSFRPATAADEQALRSLLPSGPITDLRQLPTSIPSYLVNVTPQIAINEEIVAQGPAIRLGEDLNLYYGVFDVANSGSHSSTYAVPAGSSVSVGIVGGSTSPAKMDLLSAKIEQTKLKIIAGDTAGIRQEDIYGDVFYAASLTYFTEYLGLTHLAVQTAKAAHALPFAYGTFGYEPNVQTLFGFPRAINTGGFAVNVRLSPVVQSRDGATDKRTNVNLQVGLLSSALEHRVPEQLFGNPQQPSNGVSAVKALQIAAQQGQRIYHITPANQAQALPQLRLDALALTEISQALSSGREVIAHTDRISVDGWVGEGYILFDPQTGDGAYKIAGGSNGGFFAAIGYVISVLEMFYDALNSLALTLGSKIPFLGTLVNFLKLAKFFHKVLESGLRCSNLEAVIIGITVLMIGALLIAELFTVLANPLVGFVVGAGVDFAVDWLIGQTQECSA